MSDTKKHKNKKKKKKSKKSSKDKSTKRRSSSKKRTNTSSSSNKSRGRSKSNSESFPPAEEDQSTLSPSITNANPPPYQFSSPPESDSKKRRPPRMDTSIERNIATTTTNLSFDSDNDGNVSKLGVSVDLTRGDLRPLKSPVRLIGSPSGEAASEGGERSDA